MFGETFFFFFPEYINQFTAISNHIQLLLSQNYKCLPWYVWERHPPKHCLLTVHLQRLLWQLERLFLHLEEHSWHSSPLGSTANRDHSALSPLPYTSPHQQWSLPSQGYVVRQGSWAEPAQLPQPVQVLLHSSHHGIRRARCRA